MSRALSTHAEGPTTLLWRNVTLDEVVRERKNRSHVEIDGVKVSLTASLAQDVEPPSEYGPERTTLWSFPNRGAWATHKGNYRGNWSPYIPRNLILKYTQPGELVLDQMCGSGTTLVESRLLGRSAIGVDINREAALVACSRLDFETKDRTSATQVVYRGDARKLRPLSDESVDLVATHPPYAHVIRYSKTHGSGDLSTMSFPEFSKAMEEVAKEAFRVLRPGRHCAVLAGDTRKHSHYVPVSLSVLNAFMAAGFLLKEDIIKVQHNMKTTRESWRGTYNFYLLAHEHLFVFRKPDNGEDVGRFRWSSRWW